MDLRDVVRAAQEQGFRVGRTEKGHWVFYSPDTTFSPVYFSGTPSDQRAIKNLIGKLRQAGLVWPWAGRIKN
jgi:hypothetical protein